MKMQKFFTALLISLSGMMYAGTDAKTIEDSRTYQKTFEVNADASLFVNAREADVHISTWNKNTTEVKVTITIEAFDQEDLEKAFKAFQVSIKGSPENVTVQGVSKIKNHTSFGNRMRIRTEHDNFKIKSYHYHYEIHVPETNHLNVKNRFGKVFLGHHRGNIDMELYETKLTADQIEAADGRITMKFGKGTVGSIQKAIIESYESTLSMKGAHNLNLNTKFSTFNLEKGSDVIISAYEATITLPDLNEVTIDHSFGSIKMGNGKKVTLKQYEHTFEALDVGEITSGSTKFSKIKVGEVKKMTLGEVYEDHIEARKVESFTVQAKFTVIDVGIMWNAFALDGYETTTRIDNVNTNFSTIAINGKFMSNKITLNPQAGFTISADLDFGTLNYPEGTITRNTYEKKSNNGFKMTGKSKSNGSGRITLTGYEMSTTLMF